MMKYLHLMVLGLGLVSAPALAQDDPAPTEEAAAVEESAEEADEATTEEEPAADAPASDEASEDAAEEPTEEEATEPTEEAAEEAADTDEAVEVPETDEEAVDAAMLLVEAIQAEQWPIAVGLLLTLLVYGFNRFGLKGKLSDKVVPWVALAAGALGGIGTGLASGTPVVEAIVAGLLGAGAAVGGWEVVIKNLTAPAENSGS